MSHEANFQPYWGGDGWYIKDPFTGNPVRLETGDSFVQGANTQLYRVRRWLNAHANTLRHVGHPEMADALEYAATELDRGESFSAYA